MKAVRPVIDLNEVHSLQMRYDRTARYERGRNEKMERTGRPSSEGVQGRTFSYVHIPLCGSE